MKLKLRFYTSWIEQIQFSRCDTWLIHCILLNTSLRSTNLLNFYNFWNHEKDFYSSTHYCYSEPLGTQTYESNPHALCNSIPNAQDISEPNSS